MQAKTLRFPTLTDCSNPNSEILKILKSRKSGFRQFYPLNSLASEGLRKSCYY